MTRTMPTRPRGSNRPTVVDLFAGAGLFSHAFEREGFAIVQAIELNPNAAATYAANFGDEHLVVDDVARCRPSGRCDVIIAGPPCQGFSSLGLRDRADPRNRLSLQVARWAAVMRPELVVIENVANFIDSRVWRLLVGRLEHLGYVITSEVCDASGFGVPQRRLRSVTIASRTGEVRLPVARRREPTTVRDAWAGLPRRPDGRGLNVYLPTSRLALARMKVIPPGGDKRDIMLHAPRLVPPSWRRSRIEITDVWGRMLWHEPANTLRCEFVNPSKGRYIHPDEHRVISLREGARLQSIPDDFEFASTVPYRVARQIGNSVPPLLGRAIARAVARALG